MKKSFLKHISLILIATFTFTNVSTSYPVNHIMPIQVSTVETLAVELPSKPIVDKSIKSAMRLKVILPI